MKYPKVLEAHGLTEKTVSRPILLKIREYNTLSESIDALRAKSESGTATDKFKEDAKKTIEDARNEMAELDVDIVNSITKWVKNRPVNAEKARLLREAKAAKRNGGGTAAPDPVPAPAAAADPAPAAEPAPVIPIEPTGAPASDPVPAPAAAAANAPVTDPVPAAAPPASEPPAKTENKSSGIGWGWIAAAVVVVVGGIFGIRQMNKS